MTAASARIEIGDTAGALRDFKEIAGELADKGREAEAIEVLREAARLNPDDDEVRDKLLDVYFAAGDFDHARECATTVEQFRMLAAALEANGRPDEALDALRQAAAVRSRRQRTGRPAGARVHRQRRARGGRQVSQRGDAPATILDCC